MTSAAACSGEESAELADGKCELLLPHTPVQDSKTTCVKPPASDQANSGSVHVITTGLYRSVEAGS